MSGDRSPRGSRTTRYRGRVIPRDAGGLTWRDRDYRAKALQREQEIRVRSGELVEVEAVRAGHADMRAILVADLLGTLPLRVAELLSPKIPPQEARAAVLAAVREALAAWHKAGIPTPDGQPDA